MVGLEEGELYPLFSAPARKWSRSVHQSQDSQPFRKASEESEPSLSHSASGFLWLLIANEEAGGQGDSTVPLAGSPTAGDTQEHL